MNRLAFRSGLLVASLLALSGCNQSNPGAGNPPTSAPAAGAAALPPPPVPPAVPRSHRNADEEARWRRYEADRQAYDAALAQARAQGRAEQGWADQGRQDQAFDAGRRDQAASDRWAAGGAFQAGRQDQAAVDQWRQAGAFAAGRADQAHIDQGRIDQAERDLAIAYRQAQQEPDPRRRAEMIAQARAELAAAEAGR